MVYQTSTYKLTIYNNCIRLSAFNLPLGSDLQYTITDISDTNYSDYKIQGRVLTNTEVVDCLSKDGKYRISIKSIPSISDCLEITDLYIDDEYTFELYTIFDNNYITELKDFICKCSNCEDNKLADCNYCKDDNYLKNTINSFIFIIFHTLYYQKIQNPTRFFDYLKQLFDIYERRISNRFYKMFVLGKVRGTYELDYESKYILLVSFYVYNYFMEVHNADSILAVKNKYDIETIKNCIFNNGLDFDTFEDIFFKTNIFGDIMHNQYNCDGDTLCQEIIQQEADFDNLRYTRQEFERGISFKINGINERMFIILPKVWGKVNDIVDETYTSIIKNFTVFDFKNFYVYFSNINYSTDVYTIKILYND